MKIALDRRRTRWRWHAVLADRLRTRGCAVCIRPDAKMLAQADYRSASLKSLLLLEQTLADRSRAWLCARLSRAEDNQVWLQSQDFDDPVVVLDLAATPHIAHDLKAVRTLTPTFDGIAGEVAFWNALLSSRAPLIGVFDSHTGDTTPLALPALESPHRLLESAEAVLTHLVAALDRAVSDIAAGRPIRAMATTPAPIAMPVAHVGQSMPGNRDARTRGGIAHLAQRVARKAAKKRDELLQRAPVWQVAWRTTGTRTHPPRSLSYQWFNRLPDDGRRYYADPFVIHHAGTHHVFVEEFPFATGRGVISHFTIDGETRASPPRVVLEERHHLSYPQVFAHGGEIWMLPEASAAGRLDLYRARRFPDLWERHATLIDAPLHDATFFAAPDRLWIFAGSTLEGASTWDTLSLYSARRLEGPWIAHPLNPVLVDARAARPAGALYMHDGALWRPAQDCTKGYGGALTLNRVTRLDPEGFAQELVTTWQVDPGGGSCGPHTLNFAGGIEVIDLFQPRPRR